ncbi:MAG: MaoC/PaaZ C-terminal domain-containing protein, partial [Spongiibacter sp.]
MEIRIKQGDRASLSKTFTEREVLLFSELSEDRSPIHIDVAAGEASIFGAQVVHGMLVASLISGLL